MHTEYSPGRSRYATRTYLNKFKRTEIISNIFSDHSGMKLEISYKKKSGKITNMWRLNKIIVNSQWVIKETKGEIKKYPETETEVQHTKTYGMQQTWF